MSIMHNDQIYKEIRKIMARIECEELAEKKDSESYDEFTDAMAEIGNLAAINADGRVLIEALWHNIDASGILPDEEHSKYPMQITKSETEKLVKFLEECIKECEEEQHEQTDKMG